jgi:hypothetical protein
MYSIKYDDTEYFPQIALMVRIKNKLTPEQQSRLRQLRGKPAEIY